MRDFLLYASVGFFAQLIDGVTGMGYGVTASTFLLWAGVPPGIASASVHAAEVVTTGFSGLAHMGFGNVDRAIVKRLLVPGIIGAVVGAYLLVSFPGDVLRPWIAAYLLVMGIAILARALRRRLEQAGGEHRFLVPLGFAGGFFDTLGGGGWGPIVVGTLVARGGAARQVIGSASFAEFFVTLAASLTFMVTIGLWNWKPIVGLAVGGALAAPVAALLTGKVPVRPLLITVGIVVVLLSIRTIWVALR